MCIRDRLNSDVMRELRHRAREIPLECQNWRVIFRTTVHTIMNNTDALWPIPSFVWKRSSTYILFMRTHTFQTPSTGHMFLPRAHAQGVEFVFLSSPKKILRWRELAPSGTSEHIRSFEDTPILLTCTCYWADSLPLATISAVFLLSGPLCQPFYLRP